MWGAQSCQQAGAAESERIQGHKRMMTVRVPGGPFDSRLVAPLPATMADAVTDKGQQLSLERIKTNIFRLDLQCSGEVWK